MRLDPAAVSDAPFDLPLDTGDAAVMSSVELLLSLRVANVSYILGGRSLFGIDSKSRLALSILAFVPLTFKLFSSISLAAVTSVFILLILLAQCHLVNFTSLLITAYLFFAKSSIYKGTEIG